jgi:hypothetical protein
MTVEIIGLDNVTAEMRKRLSNLPRRSGVRAISAGAKVIKDKARSLAPVRGKISRGRRISMASTRIDAAVGISKVSKATARRYGRKVGTLRRSIGYKFVKGGAGSIAVKILARDPVAHLLEFGHKSRLGQHKKSSKRTYRAQGSISFVAARAFMRPAIEASQSAAVSRIFEVIQKDMAT